MKKTGASLVRHALEQLGVRYTFGIPGVHNTEIYDELASSPTVTPVRVTHEGGAAFMADAVGRTNAWPGALLIVPAAGTALAYAGIGEAFLDGIPMLVISGGIHGGHGYRYQLHEIDQLEMVRAVTKARWRVTQHEDIVPTLFEAWRVATGGEPGPVFVEIPVDLQLFPGEVSALPAPPPPLAPAAPDAAALDAAAALLRSARRPGLFLGWGRARRHRGSGAAGRAAGGAGRHHAAGPERLPGRPSAAHRHGHRSRRGARGHQRVRRVRRAAGRRHPLGEIATGSFGLRPAWKLVHTDINPAVFHANYPAEVAIAATPGGAAGPARAAGPTRPRASRAATCARASRATSRRTSTSGWRTTRATASIRRASSRPAARAVADDAYLLADDGNHTFLVAELFAPTRSRHVLSPTDFNCMGWCVPAAIGVKLTHTGPAGGRRGRDGAFLMTGLEILTATEHRLGIVYYVFNDGELSQISQGAAAALQPQGLHGAAEVQFRGIAHATGAAYLPMNADAEIDAVIAQAEATAAEGRPVVVDVRIDYSKPTRFTQGIVRTNLQRMDWGSKARLIGRAAWRRVVQPQ